MNNALPPRLISQLGSGNVLNLPFRPTYAAAALAPNRRVLRGEGIYSF